MVHSVFSLYFPWILLYVQRKYTYVSNTQLEKKSFSESFPTCFPFLSYYFVWAVLFVFTIFVQLFSFSFLSLSLFYYLMFTFFGKEESHYTEKCMKFTELIWKWQEIGHEAMSERARHGGSTARWAGRGECRKLWERQERVVLEILQN